MKTMGLYIFNIRQSSWKWSKLYCFQLVQGNLFQKPLLLHELTHNVTKNCSLNYEFSTWKLHVVYINCSECQNKNKQFVSTTCSFLVHEQYVVILWVSWCKNKCFWQRFTCTSTATFKTMLMTTNFIFEDGKNL